MNIRKTSPSSARKRVSSPATNSPNPCGPIASPASRYPIAAGMRQNVKNPTARTEAKIRIRLGPRYASLIRVAIANLLGRGTRVWVRTC